MPRPKSLKPQYCRHRDPTGKTAGRAFVRIDGRRTYLGAYGSQASRDEYDRLVGEWIARGRQSPPSAQQQAGDGTAPDAGSITIFEIVAGFWTHATTYYRKPDGTPTNEAKNFRCALRPLLRLYGPTPATAFGPLALRAMRDEMIRLGWVRTRINRDVNRVRQVFKWAAARELIPAAVHHALCAVEPLQAGRSNAAESEPVKPVAAEYVAAVLSLVAPQVKAMIEIQHLTGMRPGEVVRMRGMDLDTTGKLWEYKPAVHKTEHLGHERIVPLGKRCQKVIGPFLKLDPSAYLFSPADAMQAIRVRRRAVRGLPELEHATAGDETPRQQPTKGRTPGARYTVESYCRAIHAACELAFPPPDHLARGRVSGRGRKHKSTRAETDREWRARLGKEGWAELERWRESHRWHPHQLRHTAGTNLRKDYGVEATQAILGHKSLKSTELYAERNIEAARRVMGEVG